MPHPTPTPDPTAAPDPDSGPCAQCHVLIRRYGSQASTLCPACTRCLARNLTTQAGP